MEAAQERLSRPGSDFRRWLEAAAADRDLVARLAQERDPAKRVLLCADRVPMPDFELAEPRKDLNEANKFKEEGNRLFKEGRFHEARDAYTNSIRLFPVDRSDDSANSDYAIVLANRSAAHDSNRLFASCQQDIEAAFRHGYPRKLHYKVYNRLGKALLKQRKFGSSREAFKKCLDMIGKSDLATKARDEFRAKVNKQMTVFNVGKNKTPEDRPASPRPGSSEAMVLPTEGTDGAAAAISGGLVIANTPVIGFKHQHVDLETMTFAPASAAAAFDGESGDGAVLIEVPESAVLMDEEDDLDGAEEAWSRAPKTCPHTLDPMPAAVPCRFGSDVMFRTEEVAEAASASYHKYEWRLHRPVRVLGMTAVARLALRLVTRMASADVKGLAEKASCDAGEDNACAIAASLLLRLLEAVDFPVISRKNLAAVLYRSAMASLRLSATVEVPTPPRSREALFALPDMPTRPIALAIFPAFHSLRQQRTSPAALDSGGVGPQFHAVFTHSTLVVAAVRYLKKGQPVDFSDVLLPGEVREMRERKEAAAGQNGQPKPKREEDEEITLRCTADGCPATFDLKEYTNRTSHVTCPMAGCKQETNTFLRLKKLQELRAGLAEALTAVRREPRSGEQDIGELREAAAGLRRAAASVEAVVARPFPLLEEADRHLRIAQALLSHLAQSAWMRNHI